MTKETADLLFEALTEAGETVTRIDGYRRKGDRSPKTNALRVNDPAALARAAARVGEAVAEDDDTVATVSADLAALKTVEYRGAVTAY